MPEHWRLVMQPVPGRGSWNMAVDDALLEAAGSGKSQPTLRLYAWEPACLSLGYAQPISDVDRDRLASRGWDLVRRPTGGRAVLHVDEMTYSVTGPLGEPSLAGSVLVSYNRLAAALVKALGLLGLEVQIQEGRAPTGRDTNPVCFEMPSTYEITTGGKKLVGSAQARRRGGMLQHGSLPLKGDLGRILQVLAYPDETSRLQATDRLLQRATTIQTALRRDVTWEEAAEACVTAFASVLEVNLETDVLSREEMSRAEELESTRFDNPGWTNERKS